MSKILSEDIAQQVKEVFDDQLKQPVEILLFSNQAECKYCEEIQQLLEEVVATSDKLNLSIYDTEKDKDTSRQYNISISPMIVIAARDGDKITNYGVRFAGIPSGHEFSSLIQSLILVSSRDSGLNPKTRDYLKKLKQPLHLQVFVTPTCPYCPRAVVLAHQFAIESSLVEAEMVEAMEFPDLANQHHVSGVPQTTINDGGAHVVGAVPEDYLLAEILKIVNN